MFQTIFAR